MGERTKHGLDFPIGHAPGAKQLMPQEGDIKKTILPSRVMARGTDGPPSESWFNTAPDAADNEESRRAARQEVRKSQRLAYLPRNVSGLNQKEEGIKKERVESSRPEVAMTLLDKVRDRFRAGGRKIQGTRQKAVVAGVFCTVVGLFFLFQYGNESGHSAVVKESNCSLEVLVYPGDSFVQVGERVFSPGDTVHDGLCGRFSVVIQHATHEEYRGEIVLEEGRDNVLEQRLVPHFVSLEILTTPPGALVKFGSKNMGRTPFFKKVQRSEPIELQLSKEGFQSQKARLVPVKRRTIRLRLIRTRPDEN